MNSNYKLIAGNRGFTILELMIVMVIASIGLTLATPYYQDVTHRRETTAQAEDLVAFMSFAQGEAIKNNEMISVTLTYTDKDNWCMGANEGNAPCDCTEVITSNADFCSLNGVAAIITSAAYTKSGMTDYNETDTTLVFDPVRGTMDSADFGTDHGIILESDNGNWSLKVDVEATGRIRICNPDPDKAVPGYQPCPVVPVV